MLGLKNKNVFISGSSSGIGLDIAEKFLHYGSNVIINGRKKNKLKKIVTEFNEKNLHYIDGDVTEIKDVKKIYLNTKKIFKRIDILICNVGSGKSVAPGKENYKEWQRVFALNFWSTTNLVEVFKNDLIKSKGNIVCISSICGLEKISNAPITYSVAKSSLNSYVKSMSKYFGPFSVRINSIAPGNILFKNSSWDKKLRKNKKTTLSYINSNVPLNKFGKLEDISETVIWIASEKSNFTTGATFIIDGGQTSLF